MMCKDIQHLEGAATGAEAAGGGAGAAEAAGAGAEVDAEKLALVNALIHAQHQYVCTEFPQDRQIHLLASCENVVSLLTKYGETVVRDVVQFLTASLLVDIEEDKEIKHVQFTSLILLYLGEITGRSFLPLSS